MTPEQIAIVDRPGFLEAFNDPTQSLEQIVYRERASHYGALALSEMLRGSDRIKRWAKLAASFGFLADPSLREGWR